MSDNPNDPQPQPESQPQPQPQPQGPAFALETPTYQVVEKGHDQSGLETRDTPH